MIIIDTKYPPIIKIGSTHNALMCIPGHTHIVSGVSYYTSALFTCQSLRGFGVRRLACIKGFLSRA